MPSFTLFCYELNSVNIFNKISISSRFNLKHKTYPEGKKKVGKVSKRKDIYNIYITKKLSSKKENVQSDITGWKIIWSNVLFEDSPI